MKMDAEKNVLIFELAEITFSPLENYDAFYTRFRENIVSYLKKSGNELKYLNDTQTLHDEIIPTNIEDIIIIWCLEKIDQKLPLLAKQIYSSQLVDNVTIKDLQPEIFKNIPDLLGHKEIVEKNDVKKSANELLKDENLEVHVKCEDELDFENQDLYPFDVSETDRIEDIENENADKVVVDEKECKECEKSFSSRKRMLAHQAYHRLEPVQCEFCQQQLKNRSYLQIHIRRAHKATFTCKTCDSLPVYDNQLTYERHIKDYHRDLYKGRYDLKVRKYSYICRYCHKPLINYQALREHTFKHIETKDICLVGQNVEDLKLLERIDVEGDTFVKEIISERDENEIDMENIFNDTEDDFVCDYCGKECLCKKSLISHQISHRYDPCTCEFCDEVFRNRRSLRLHIRKIHKATFHCKDCDLKLTNQLMFERHIKDFHKELYKGRYDLRVKRYKHLCRYCHQPQVSHKVLKEHTYQHIDNNEIQLNSEDFPISVGTVEDSNIVVESEEEYDQSDLENDDICDTLERFATDEELIATDLNKDLIPKRKRGRKRKIKPNPETNIKRLRKKRKGVDKIEAETLEDLKEEDGIQHSDNEFKVEDTITKNGSSTKYKCYECGKKFPSKTLLSDHMTHHDTDPCSCEFCDKEFQNRRVLQGHIRNLHKVTFTCKYCTTLVSGQIQFEKHLKEFHIDEFEGNYDTLVTNAPFICRYCYLPQDNQDMLKEHILNHKENKEIYYSMKGDAINAKENKVFEGKDEQRICDVCGKSVNLRSMPAHMKSHVANPLSCQECNIDFEDKRMLRMHMKKHKSNEVVASCEECGKTFTRHDSLKNHMKLHKNGGEKLKCETCKRSFFTKKAMGSHVCKHNACDICGEKFQRVRNLTMHKKGHFGEEIFPCGKCESIFISKKRLREHVRELHEKEKKHKCEICDKRFIMKSGLVEHTRTHTGEKPYKCDMCEMAFTQKGNLDTHMKLHKNEMPFQCVNCKQRFRQVGDLKRHREFQKCGFTQEDFYNSLDPNSKLKNVQPV